MLSETTPSTPKSNRLLPTESWHSDGSRGTLILSSHMALQGLMRYTIFYPPPKKTGGFLLHQFQVNIVLYVCGKKIQNQIQGHVWVDSSIKPPFQKWFELGM